MTTPHLGLSRDAIAAIVIPIAAIAAAFAVIRAVARRDRRDARDRARSLMRAFADYLESRLSGRELRRAVQSGDDATFWTTLETLAFRLKRSEWRRLVHELERNRHEAAERLALRDDSPWRRELAARRLGLLPSRAARRALRRALEDGPGIVSFAGAMGLARAHDARALRWILGNPGAFATRSPQARTALLRAFGRGALPALEKALEGDRLDRRLERAIIETLGLARRTAAASAIARRLLSSDPEIRLTAARALGRLRTPECAAALLSALTDEAWQVRAQAARALGRLRLPVAIPQLSACLTDRSWWVRRHAAYALSGIGDEGCAALRGAAEGSPDPYARDIALEALENGRRKQA